MEVVKDKKTARLLWYLVQITEKLLDKNNRLIDDDNITYMFIYVDLQINKFCGYHLNNVGLYFI